MTSREERKAVVESLYSLLMDEANRFLHHAENYSISVLKLENPTYAQIAKQFRQVVGLITILAEDDQMIGDKADDYVTLMEGIATAIDAENDEALQEYVQQLARRPFL